MTTAPSSVAEATPPASARWFRRRRVLTFGVAGLVMLALVATAAGALIVPASAPASAPPTGSPWAMAAMTALDIGYGPGSDVVVRGVTREALDDAGAVSRYGRRLAKVAWRTHPGMITTLSLDVVERDGPHRVSARWTRSQLLAAFGPRSPGLDAGDVPGRPAKVDGPYRHRAVVTLLDGMDVTTELLTATARDHLHRDQPGPLQITEPIECAFGDGTVRIDVFAAVIQVDGDAEALLPDIADYWTSLGLDLKGRDLDAGLPTVTAHLPPGYGASVAAFTDADHPHLLHLAGGTGCLFRGPRTGG